MNNIFMYVIIITTDADNIQPKWNAVLFVDDVIYNCQ